MIFTNIIRSSAFVLALLSTQLGYAQQSLQLTPKHLAFATMERAITALKIENNALHLELAGGTATHTTSDLRLAPWPNNGDISPCQPAGSCLLTSEYRLHPGGPTLRLRVSQRNGDLLFALGWHSDQASYVSAQWRIFADDAPDSVRLENRHQAIAHTAEPGKAVMLNHTATHTTYFMLYTRHPLPQQTNPHVVREQPVLQSDWLVYQVKNTAIHN